MNRTNFILNGLNELDDEDLNLDLNNNDEDDFLLAKIKDLEPKLSKNGQCDNKKNNESDEEDELLMKSQALFETTNNINNIKHNHMNDDNNSVQENEYSNLDCSINISTQSTRELLSKCETTKSNLDEKDTHNECWNHALKELKSKLTNLKFAPNLLSKYIMEFYFKKFFAYDFLNRSDDQVMKRIPILLVKVKSLTFSKKSVNLTLTDGKNDICASLSNETAKEFTDCISIGSVFFLENIICMQLNLKKKNGYHLNLQKDNFLNIYYLEKSNSEGTDYEKSDEKKTIPKPKCLQINNIDANKIKQYLNEFDKRYVKLSDVSLNTTSNTTINNLTNKSLANKSNCLNKKTTPYMVPNQMNKNNNAPINNNNKFQKPVPPLPTPIHSSISNSSTQTKTLNKNSLQNEQPPLNKTLTNSNYDVNIQSQGQVNRTFNFKVSNSSCSTFNKIVNKNTSNTIDDDISNFNSEKFNLVSTQINSVSSSQRNVLSEEAFSQLIFGIEDEFLDDD